MRAVWPVLLPACTLVAVSAVHLYDVLTVCMLQCMLGVWAMHCCSCEGAALSCEDQQAVLGAETAGCVWCYTWWGGGHKLLVKDDLTALLMNMVWDHSTAQGWSLLSITRTGQHGMLWCCAVGDDALSVTCDALSHRMGVYKRDRISGHYGRVSSVDSCLRSIARAVCLLPSMHADHVCMYAC